MAHVEKHHRRPCERCGHSFSKHGKTSAPCTAAGCGCKRWKPYADDKETYRARWVDPSRKERSKTFVRKIDAEQHLVGVEDSKLRGAYVDPAAGKKNLGEWAERWYGTTADLKPSTRHYYRQLLDGQVLPEFEKRTLAEIDKMMVQEWLAGLTGKGKSASRVRGAHSVLSMILESAVDGGRLARNAATGVRLPRRSPKEMHFLTAAQVEKLAASIGSWFSMLVLTAAYTGMRPGELVALRVKRLHLLKGTCDVAESATEVDGKLTWGTPKTWERRTVRLPRFLCDELGAWLEDRPHEPGDLVFTMKCGGPVREKRLMERYFRPALPGAGLPDGVRMHDLRHTCASLLIASGATVKAVQAQLGHKSAMVTLNTYGHLFPDEMERLAERLDKVRADARTDRPRTEDGATVVRIAEGAGQ